MVERKMVTRQGYGLGIGGCKRLCPAANMAWLGYTFSMPVSIKDRSLYKASWASHIFIVSSAYLGMGVGKTCCSLVVDLALFRPTDRRWRWWRSLHHTESRT